MVPAEVRPVLCTALTVRTQWRGRWACRLEQGDADVCVTASIHNRDIWHAEPLHVLSGVGARRAGQNRAMLMLASLPRTRRLQCRYTACNALAHWLRQCCTCRIYKALCPCRTRDEVQVYFPEWRHMHEPLRQPHGLMRSTRRCTDVCDGKAGRPWASLQRINFGSQTCCTWILSLPQRAHRSRSAELGQTCTCDMQMRRHS